MAIIKSSKAITSTDASAAPTRHPRTAMAAFVGVAIAIGATGIATGRAQAPAPTSGSFFEPFDRLDTNKWYVSDGWVDGDHQGCTWSRDNVSATKGMVQLRLGKSANPLRQYRCGELQNTAVTGYGVYEARMRTAEGSGLNTALFTYDRATKDEIDFEFLGRNSKQVQLNYYTGGTGGHESYNDLSYDGAGGFHDYAFVWAPGSIKWYVDGKIVREASGPGLPTQPGHVILSLWNGSAAANNWLGPMDATRTPVLAEIDWIAFTKAGERCRFPRSVTCSFK